MDEKDSAAVRIFLSDWMAAPAETAPGETVYAIGDVHGNSRLLKALGQWMLADARGASTRLSRLILLGDYIDRGPDGVGVLDWISRLEAHTVDIVALFGNHELLLYSFLFDPDCDIDLVELWRRNGGDHFLRELGIDMESVYRYGVTAIRRQALERLPASALACLDRLESSARSGGYLFVHGGVDPLAPFDDDDTNTLTKMREPFLTGAGWRHDFVVVHGHTICGPDVAPHRVALDSGAFLTGVLTGVQLAGRRLRFVAATSGDVSEGLKTAPGRRLTIENWTPAN
jgi:serine/threonine protein phosphatase 1